MAHVVVPSEWAVTAAKDELDAVEHARRVVALGVSQGQSWGQALSLSLSLSLTFNPP